MLFRFLADLVLVVHFTFIAFVVIGGILALRWRGLAWFHVPAALWAMFIQFGGGICPLTPLENHLRYLGGQAGYTGGFVEHYLLALVYPAGLTRGVQLVLGLLVLASTLAVYGFLLRRRIVGGGPCAPSGRRSDSHSLPTA